MRLECFKVAPSGKAKFKEMLKITLEPLLALISVVWGNQNDLVARLFVSTKGTEIFGNVWHFSKFSHFQNQFWFAWKVISKHSSNLIQKHSEFVKKWILCSSGAKWGGGGGAHSASGTSKTPYLSGNHTHFWMTDWKTPFRALFCLIRVFAVRSMGS